MKTSIVSTPEVNKIVENLIKIKKTIKDYKRLEDKVTQDLYNYMTEHDVLINCETGEEYVNWSYSKPYMRFDSKRFEFEQPDIYKNYCKMTEPVRTLRIAK